MFVNYKHILYFSLFPVIASFLLYSEDLPLIQSVRIYKLIATVPACSATLFSILSSACPRPEQEEKSTKREKFETPLHYMMQFTHSLVI